MRIVPQLLIVSVLVSGGCSMMIAATGKDLTILKTKEPLINKLNSWHVFCMQLVYGNNSPN